jgi:hypothetical protein
LEKIVQGLYSHVENGVNVYWHSYCGIMCKHKLMIQSKKLSTPVDPRDDESLKGKKPAENESEQPGMKEKEEDDTDYDILPSNSSGLAGDDGEEIISEDEDQP